jgi:hypothetical protein
MNRSRTNLSLIALALATGSFCFTLGAWADEALTKGMSLYQLKKYQEAIDSLRASKSQGDPLLHYYVANSLASLGKHKANIRSAANSTRIRRRPIIAPKHSSTTVLSVITLPQAQPRARPVCLRQTRI